LEINQNTLIALGGFFIIALSANHISKYFSKIKLPLITGLLMTGILAGPFVFKLIPVEKTNDLNFLNEISLAFIAFAAGSELYLKQIRGQFKSILWNSFGQLLITFLVGTFGVFYMSSYLPFMQEMNAAGRFGVSILMATIFVARSPSSAIAVISEMRAKGPFTQTAIGVTVITDVFVVIIFAVCFALSKTLLSGDEFGVGSIAYLLVELLVSFGFGWVLGKILMAFFKLKINK